MSRVLQCLTDVIPDYYTPKYVTIRDKRIACLHLVFVAAIIVYILVHQLAYENKHLKILPVTGAVRMTVQHPVDRCNPMHYGCRSLWEPLSKLPYCAQYMGESPAPVQRVCVFRDAWDAAEATARVATIFVPTMELEMDQVLGCEPASGNGFACDSPPNLYTFKEDYEVVRSAKEVFVASVENFTLLLDHRFWSLGSNFTGNSATVNGSITTSHGAVLQLPDSLMPRLPDFPSAASDPIGDFISLGELFRLAKADMEWDDLVDGVKSLRQTGGMLYLDIVYSNKAHWAFFGDSPISYTISATWVKGKEYQTIYAERTDAGRVLRKRNGMMVKADVSGFLYAFSTSNLLVHLTTSIACLAMAAYVTDFLMGHCMAHSGNYQVLKYQPAQKFDDVAQLQEVTPLVEAPKLPHQHFLETLCLGRAPVCPEVLAVLIKFEQRLNRLDGMDDGFIEADTQSSVLAQTLAALEEQLVVSGTTPRSLHQVRFDQEARTFPYDPSQGI